MAQTRVASAATDTQLLAPDSARQSLIIENTDANRLYVLIDGSTSAADDYSFSLNQYENAIIQGDLASAEVRGIWAADGTGHAQITYR